MNTLIISSSLADNSRSFLLCKAVKEKLLKKKHNITFVDARKIRINPVYKEITNEMQQLTNQIKKADNIIIGMGVHCYSINDNLKILLDNCFSEANGKFYGILCAAGGERSYLSTMHLTQICMHEWRMLQLPRIVYATGKDFKNNIITSNELLERIHLFAEEFHLIGKKLLA